MRIKSASNRGVKTPAEARLHVREGTLPIETADFRNEADEINREFHRIRASTTNPSPFTSAQGFIKRESYLLIRKSIKNRFRAIKTLSKYDWRIPPQPSYTDNQFYWGFLAIDPRQEAINQKDLSLFSDQLLHAHRHNVPAEHLIGFIYQSGSQRSLRAKVENNLREDDFVRFRNRRLTDHTSGI